MSYPKNPRAAKPTHNRIRGETWGLTKSQRLDLLNAWVWLEEAQRSDAKGIMEQIWGFDLSSLKGGLGRDAHGPFTEKKHSS